MFTNDVQPTTCANAILACAEICGPVIDSGATTAMDAAQERAERLKAMREKVISHHCDYEGD